MLLTLTQWYPSKDNPVAGVFVRVHVNALRQEARDHGYDRVVVVHLDREAPWGLVEKSGDDVRIGTRVQRLLLRRTLKVLIVPLPILIAAKVCGVVGERPKAVVSVAHPAEIVGWLVARRYRRPFAAHIEHSTSFTRADSSFPQSKLQRSIRGWWLRTPKRAIAVSKGLASSLSEEFGVSGVAVVANGVDDAFFSEGIHPRDSKNAIRILSVGLLTPGKRVDHVIHAAALIKDRLPAMTLTVEIVGDGVCRVELEALARTLGIDELCRFHGIMTPRAIAQIAANSSVFVTASAFETFCVAAAEAFACGVPIVSTRSGGPESFIDPEFATFIDVTVAGMNPGADLSDAILREIERDSLARRHRARDSAAAIVGCATVGRQLWRTIDPQLQEPQIAAGALLL